MKDMLDRLIGGACILSMIGAGIFYRYHRGASYRGDAGAKRKVRLALTTFVASAVVLVLWNSLT